MKKTFLLLILTCFVIFVGCAEKYDGWKEVSIAEVGTFMIPNEWIVTHRDDILYITDKPIDEEGYKIYLIGATENNGNNTKPHRLFENVEYIGPGGGVNYSNSAAMWNRRYSINGNEEKRYVIHLFNSSKVVNLLAWDNLIDEETVIKITKSYVSE